MTIKDRIRELSKLPPRFNTMLEQGLLSVRKSQQDKLCVVACLVSNASWKRWHEQRQPEDNRQEHEWVVFANVMKIAEAECLSLSEKRVATAFAFTHDSYFIPRIMEQRIRDATTPEKKEALEKEKEEQRLRHMKGGAKNANSLLGKLKNPNKAGHHQPDRRKPPPGYGARYALRSTLAKPLRFSFDAHNPPIN